MEAIVGCSIRRVTDLHRACDAFEECLARLNRNAQIGFERNSDLLLRITPLALYKIKHTRETN